MARKRYASGFIKKFVYNFVAMKAQMLFDIVIILCLPCLPGVSLLAFTILGFHKVTAIASNAPKTIRKKLIMVFLQICTCALTAHLKIAMILVCNAMVYLHSDKNEYSLIHLKFTSMTLPCYFKTSSMQQFDIYIYICCLVYLFRVILDFSFC